MQELSLAEVAEITGGDARGDATVRIRAVASLEAAGAGDLSFVANARYSRYLQSTRAAAVLVPPTLRAEVPETLPCVVVKDPHVALYHVLARLYPEAAPPAGVHPTAVIDPTAEIAADASIGPYAVVGAGAFVGSGCEIGAHVTIGARCRVGDGSVLHAGARLYPEVRLGARCVIHSGACVGRPGFGFVWVDGGHRRVPQIGGCILGDDVEVGCNSTVDRGSIGDTVVGSGTKIDNLVQVGHNVQLGEHVILISQVGIAGSTSVGSGAVLGGQVGVGGHLSIGAGARLAGQAGVIGDVPAGAEYSGYPARPHREALRAQGALLRLPELMKRVRRLEREAADGPESPVTGEAE